MAKVGKEQLEQFELLAGIEEHSNQVYGRLMLEAVRDPRPRDFVRAGLALRTKRIANGLPELPRDVVVGTFHYLVPGDER